MQKISQNDIKHFNSSGGSLYCVFSWSKAAGIFHAVCNRVDYCADCKSLVKFLERHLKLVRRHGSMVIIVGVLILVIGLLYLAVVWTYTEMAGFVKDLPLLYDNALSEITEAIENSRKLVTYLPDSLQKPLLEISDNLGGTIGALFSKARLPQWRLREMWQKAFRTSW